MAQVLPGNRGLRRCSSFQGNGQQAAEIPVSLQIQCQKRYGGAVPDGDPRSEYRLDPGFDRCLIESNRGVKAVIRKRHGLLAQSGHFLDQLLGGKRSPEEGIGALDFKMYETVH